MTEKYKRVPVEPTPEMLFVATTLHMGIPVKGLKKIYDAILAAAPDVPLERDAVIELLETEIMKSDDVGLNTASLRLFLNKLRALKSQPPQPAECKGCADYVRYCPECGSVGEIASTFRDCCPDGSHAVYVPKSIADKLAALEARMQSDWDSYIEKQAGSKQRIAALEAELITFRLERQIRQGVERSNTELRATIAQQAKKLEATSKDAERWNTFLKFGLKSPSVFPESVGSLICSISDESTVDEVNAVMDKLAVIDAEISQGDKPCSD